MQKPGPHLAYLWALVFLWFSVDCLFAFFGDFPLIWGFSTAIHTRIHRYFSSFFSECWIAGHLQRPIGLFQL